MNDTNPEFLQKFQPRERTELAQLTEWANFCKMNDTI